MSERQGIEIDYCPECRGVWLDRGELDKIVERTVRSESPARQSVNERPVHHDHYSGHKRKKHESFLGDLFDF